MEPPLTAHVHNASLDELDFAILVQLQQDGRASFTVMAEKLRASLSEYHPDPQID